MSGRRLLRGVTRRLHRGGWNTAVKAEVSGGVVTLEGEVSSYHEYVSLGTAIGRLPGVRGVVNRVTYPGRPEPEHRRGEQRRLRTADVVIVGAGVVGCCIARQLSRYHLEVVVVEKETDVACGTSKANNGMVHTGIGEKMGTLKQRLCVEGHRQFDRLCRELQVPYRQQGMYIVLTPQSFASLAVPTALAQAVGGRLIPSMILRRAKKLGLPMRRADRREVLEAEPHLTRDVLSAVYAPTYGVTCPYRFTIALAENAVANGVQVMLGTEVVDVLVEDGRVAGVQTDRGTIAAPWVINAAGLYADVIADMAGAREYTIHPKKGAILLFDKETSHYVRHHLSLLRFPRTEHYKGGGIMLTVDGNLQWGPTITEIQDRDDRSVTREEIDAVFEHYQALLPGFPRQAVIAYFSGLRAATFTEDFVIKPADAVRGFIHVAGIQSPGLAAAPAISDLVIDILRRQGMDLRPKSHFQPRRQSPPVMRELSDEERAQHIARNPRYGRIVCRCEEVSEGEIVDAVHSPLPACTLDAVKRRTRAGMGRCQGSFCLPRVAKILARERDRALEDIEKDRPGSRLFVGPAKCLLEGGHED
ncbi:MAG: FAD-dependent oxidoreductase [Thermoplasmatota archaeon]